MNKGILSDKELNEAWSNAFDKAVYFDHKPTQDELFVIRLRAVAQAQINKGQEEGIEKVVGFLTPYILERPTTGKIRIVMDYDLWESKLKEWGIERYRDE